MPDPEVIDFSPPSPARNRLLIGGAVVGVIVIAAVVVLVGIKPGGNGSAGGQGNPAPAGLVAQVTGVPAGLAEAVGDGHGQVTGRPAVVTGSPLDANSKPEVLFVGSEYCPYCAAERWALVVALSRFGTFTGLRTIRSGNYQPYPDLATWTFYGSAYSSKYLTFVPVETRSNVPVSRTANPQDKGSYTVLQKLTGAEQAILNRYDKTSSVPFADFGNQRVMVGASFDPLVLQQQTWSQIAAALRNPASAAGQAILGTANFITAAICGLTRDQPAGACTPTIRALLGT